jgi:site-specific recombinase XerC
VMRACGESDAGVRNQALIAIMYRSGLRVAEALALYPKDVDEAAGTVRPLSCQTGGFKWHILARRAASATPPPLAQRPNPSQLGTAGQRRSLMLKNWGTRI